MTTYDGEGEAAGLVTREEIAEIRRWAVSHIAPSQSNTIKLCDRITELERVVDAECEQKYKLIAETVNQSARTTELEAANARLTEERDNLKDAIGYLQIQVREANQKLLDLRTALRAEP